MRINGLVDTQSLEHSRHPKCINQEPVCGETNLNQLKGKQEFTGFCNGKSMMEAPSHTAKLGAHITSYISQLFYSLRYLAPHGDSQKFQAYFYSLVIIGRKSISFLTIMAEDTELSLIRLAGVTGPSPNQTLQLKGMAVLTG